MVKSLFRFTFYNHSKWKRQVKNVTMGVGTYNYTFKSVVLERVEVKSVKIKKSSETLGWS